VGQLTFENAAAEIRKCAPPGAVTLVSYGGLKFAMDCGIDVWDYAETYSLQAVIRDHGSPAQKRRLQEELFAGRWASEIMRGW